MSARFLLDTNVPSETLRPIPNPLLCGKRILPITQAIAERWGILDARRQAAGNPFDLTLVTRNVKDFTLSAPIFQSVGDVGPPYRIVSALFCSPRGRVPMIRLTSRVLHHPRSTAAPRGSFPFLVH
jgi:hypothetical protein